MMTPYTRREIYLAILNGEEYEIPDPLTREEVYLAKACGMDIEAPEPKTRYEMLLANLSDGEYNITPLTRLECLVAKAAGVEAPELEPKTREELWWKNAQGSSDPLITLSGSLVRFTSSASKPFVSTEVSIVPQQSGSGDPSPDNVRPISGWDAVKVMRTGKNLADDAEFSIEKPSWSTAQYWIGLSKNADGTFTLTRPIGWGGTGFVYIGTFKAGTYKLSFDLISTANVTCGATCAIKKKQTWDDEVAVPSVTGLTATGRYSFNDFTITDECDVWIAVSSYNTNGAEVISGNYQLEYGDTASTYEPYNGNTYTIQLGDTIYGGTLTVLEDGSVKLRATWVEQTVTECGSVAISSTGIPYATCPTTSAPKLEHSSNNSISSVYRFRVNAPSDSGWFRIISPQIYIFDTRFTSKVVADSILAEEKPQFCYPLETPIEYDLADVTILNTIKGENNVWADSGDIEVTVYGTEIVEPDLNALQSLNIEEVSEE